MSTSILRRKKVTERTGLGKSTIYKWMKEGRFPKPVPLNDAGTAVGWREDEIDQWLEGRFAAAAVRSPSR